MTVMLNSGIATDHAVGLVAMSKHQGAWSHTPNMKLATRAEGDFADWLGENLGIGASRASRAPFAEQFTGHTAVLSRTGGRVAFARGFVPSVTGYIGAFIGSGGEGHWQDDLAMLGDPTCISFEIPVTEPQARAFESWFKRTSCAINVYSLKQGNAHDSFNCVLGAVTVLTNYLLDLGGYETYVSQLMTVNSSGQGPLMSKMMGGFQ